MGYFLKNVTNHERGWRRVISRKGKAHLAATLYRLKNPAAKGWKRYCRDSGSVYRNAPGQRRKQRTTKIERPAVLLLPVAAIQYGTQNKTFVYLVDDTDPSNATVSMKDVVVGTIDDDGNRAEIQSGINEGDVVVIDGVDKLTNGAKVILSTGDDSKKQSGAAADATPGT